MQKFLFSFLLFTILCLANNSVYAKDVAVIKSEGIEPYEQAFEGFKSVYKGSISEFVISGRRKNNRDVLDSIEADAPDVILSIGIDALLFAKDKINDVPIVYCMVMDPEKYGLVNSDNIRGITLRVSTIDQMRKIKSIIPNLKRLGIIYNPKNTGYLVKEARNVSKALGIDLVAEKVMTEKSVPKALRKLSGIVDAIWLVADATVVTRDSFDFIILYTLENSIPLVAYSEAFVQAGALMALSVDYFKIGNQAAELVSNVINKKAISIGSIIEPEHSFLIINIKTAKTIGLDIPAEVIESTEKVFK